MGWKREDIEKHSGVDAEDSGHDSALETWGARGTLRYLGNEIRSLDGLDGLRARRGVNVGPSG